MKKILMGLVGAAAFWQITQAPAQAADCGEVSITEMNCVSSAVVKEVAKFIMGQDTGSAPRNPDTRLPMSWHGKNSKRSPRYR